MKGTLQPPLADLGVWGGRRLNSLPPRLVSTVTTTQHVTILPASGGQTPATPTIKERTERSGECAAAQRDGGTGKVVRLKLVAGFSQVVPKIFMFCDEPSLVTIYVI